MADQRVGHYSLNPSMPVTPVKATPQVAGVLAQLPDGIRALMVGTSFRGTVQARTQPGMIPITTPYGTFQLQTSMTLQEGDPLQFTVLRNGSSLQLQLQEVTQPSVNTAPLTFAPEEQVAPHAEKAFTAVLSPLVTPLSHAALIQATFLSVKMPAFSQLLQRSVQAQRLPLLRRADVEEEISEEDIALLEELAKPGLHASLRPLKLFLTPPPKIGKEVAGDAAEEDNEPQKDELITHATVISHNERGEAVLQSELGLLLLHECPLPLGAICEFTLHSLMAPSLSHEVLYSSLSPFRLSHHWPLLINLWQEGWLEFIPTLEASDFLAQCVLWLKHFLTLNREPAFLRTDTPQALHEQFNQEYQYFAHQPAAMDSHHALWHCYPLPLAAADQLFFAQLYYHPNAAPKEEKTEGIRTVRFIVQCAPEQFGPIELRGLYHQHPQNARGALDLHLFTSAPLPATIQEELTALLKHCFEVLHLPATLGFAVGELNHFTPYPPPSPLLPSSLNA